MTKELRCFWCSGAWGTLFTKPADSYALALADLVLFSDMDGYVSLETTHRGRTHKAVVAIIDGRPKLLDTFLKIDRRTGKYVDSGIPVPERYHQELKAGE
ncbi:hypothetical protein [Rhizobium sp. RAF56]|uniref:hypothetical protein n=1 Tax=Rhizobium sp. RAF56 TaxID=3233062 RepID=UPI003F9C43CB